MFPDFTVTDYNFLIWFLSTKHDQVVITVQIEDAFNHPELSDVLEDNGVEDVDDEEDDDGKAVS